MRCSYLPLACPFILLLISCSANGQIYYGKDTSVSTDLRGRGGVSVGYDTDTNKSSPCTVTVVNGGFIDKWEIFGGSTGILSGGDSGEAGAVDESLVFSFGSISNGGPSPLPAILIINSGTFGSLIAGDGQTVGGTVSVNGGQTTVSGSVPYQAFGTGVFNLNAGTLNGFIAVGSHNTRDPASDAETPIANLSGGSLTALNGATGNLTAADGATVNLTGTTIAGGVTLYNSAQFAMSGGSVAQGLAANQNSTATITGGTLTGGIAAGDSSAIKLSTAALILGSVFTSGGATLNAGSGSGINGDVNINNSVASNMSLSGAVVAGNVNVGGPVQVVLGSAQIQKDVTLNATPALFLPSLSSSNAEIDGNLNLNGFSQAMLSGGEVGGNVNANNASSLTVDGFVEIKQGVLINDSSSLEIKGGTIDGLLTVVDQATAVMTGGSVKTVLTSAVGGKAHDGFTMQGGVITNNLVITGNGTATLSGGAVNTDLEIDNSAHASLIGSASVHGFIRVNSGSVDLLDGFVGAITITGGNATSSVRGGTVFQNVEVDQPGLTFPNFELDGGLIGFDLNVRSGASAEMRFGEVAHNVNVFNALFTLEGGKIDNQLNAFGNSNLIITGGQIGKGPAGAVRLAAQTGHMFASGTTPEIICVDQSSVEIHGMDLTANLVDPTVLDPDFQGSFTEYALFGSLTDGSSLDGAFMLIQNPAGSTPGASFSLVNVPEPSASIVAPLAAAFIFLRRTRASATGRAGSWLLI